MRKLTPILTILILGIALRLLCIFWAQPFGRYSDEPAHWNYISYIGQNHELPTSFTPVSYKSGLDDLWGSDYENWQSPVYYTLTATWCSVFGFTTTIARLFSLLLWILTFAGVLTALRAWKLDESVILVGLAAIAFTPSLIQLFSAVNNLTLSVCFGAWAVAFLARGQFLWACLSVALATVTKWTAAPLALVLIPEWWRLAKEKDMRAVYGMVLCGALVLAQAIYSGIVWGGLTVRSGVWNDSLGWKSQLAGLDLCIRSNWHSFFTCGGTFGQFQAGWWIGQLLLMAALVGLLGGPDSQISKIVTISFVGFVALFLLSVWDSFTFRSHGSGRYLLVFATPLAAVYGCGLEAVFCGWHWPVALFACWGALTVFVQGAI